MNDSVRLKGRIERCGGKAWLDYRERGDNNVEIEDINVPNEYRERGIGREMVDELRRKMTVRNLLIFAVTRVSNVPACQFYEALGFRVVGRLHQFYREREDMKDGASGYHHAIMYGLDL